MSKTQQDFITIITEWLMGLGWTGDQIEAYLTAQVTHGVLAPHQPSWVVRSAIASWTVDRPKTPLRHGYLDIIKDHLNQTAATKHISIGIGQEQPATTNIIPR